MSDVLEAAKDGDVATLRRLIAAGGDVNYKGVVRLH